MASIETLKGSLFRLAKQKATELIAEYPDDGAILVFGALLEAREC